MINQRPAQIRISEDELIALLGPVPEQSRLGNPVPASIARSWGADVGIDIWFKYRNMFLLAVAVAYTCKLFFFPEMAAANFSPAVKRIRLRGTSSTAWASLS